MKRSAVALAAVIALGRASAALAASSLSGKYQTKVTGNHLFGGALNGTWTIKFAPGAYHVSENGRAVVHGKDTITGNVITLKDVPGPASCPTKGKYRFSLHGKPLTFKRISDSTSGNCLGRVIVLKHRCTKA